MIHRAQLRSGESVSIHSGAGGLGQACIQVENLYEADIFVTIGSDDKRQLVVDQYGIPEDHIFSSRIPAFAQRIKDMTAGRAVDIVINSLAGETLGLPENVLPNLASSWKLGKKTFIPEANYQYFFSQRVLRLWALTFPISYGMLQILLVICSRR